MPIPDLAVIARERIQNTVDKDEWLTGSPELVVEVSSPSNRKLHPKADLYLAYGAEQVWILYPLTNTVIMATPNGATETGIGDALEFHGAQVPVASLFRQP